MLFHPIQLFIAPEGELGIDWSDGQRRLYTVRQLRQACPCATCQAQRSDPAAPHSAPQVEPGLAIASMDPVGNYGYKIRFSDGHDTGIFTLELLRVLGAPAEK